MIMNKPTIAYVAQFFPYMTETFVYREVLALREKGFNVVTLANRQPQRERLAEESKPLMDSTSYFFPIRLLTLLMAHFYFILTYPQRYFSTIYTVFSPKGESWSNRWRTFGHWVGGVQLAKVAEEKGVQHIHAHFSVNAATIGLVISRLIDVPFSFTVHNNFFTDRLILREKLRHAKFIIAISEYSRDWLLDYAPEIPDLKEKFQIIHCGISLDQFRPKQLAHLNGKVAHKPLIFSLAYHAERKGMPYLVEACRILRDRGVEFECIIGGNGPETPLLREMIQNYRLEESVKLPGVIFQENLNSYLVKSNVFILPCITAANGDKDGVPVVLMEAMAMQIPVVSTTVSGIPELIDHGVNGLLVPEKESVALADAIQYLLEDPEFATKIGRLARQKIAHAFNIHTTSDQLIHLFGQHLSVPSLFELPQAEVA